jgi:hypothetical protein
VVIQHFGGALSEVGKDPRTVALERMHALKETLERSTPRVHR